MLSSVVKHEWNSWLDGNPLTLLNDSPELRPYPHPERSKALCMVPDLQAHASSVLQDSTRSMENRAQDGLALAYWCNRSNFTSRHELPTFYSVLTV